MREIIPPLLFSLFLTSLVFLTTPVTSEDKGFDKDGQHYGVMAGYKGFDSNLAYYSPWCYRTLTPKLASFLPWKIIDNFRFLSFCFCFLGLFLFYFYWLTYLHVFIHLQPLFSSLLHSLNLLFPWKDDRF